MIKDGRSLYESYEIFHCDYMTNLNAKTLEMFSVWCVHASDGNKWCFLFVVTLGEEKKKY